MMQRLLACKLSATIKSFTSSSSPILPRSPPFSSFHNPPIINKPISTSSSPFIKQSSSNAFYSNPTYSYVAKTLSDLKSFKLFTKPLFSQLCPSVIGASVAASYGVRFFRPGFSNKGFGFKQSSFSSQFGGWRSRLSRFSSDDVVLGLIVANVAVFMLWRVADQEFMLNNFTLSLNNFKSGRVHTMITSAFSHIDVGHIVSNMVGLYFFGTSIGRYFGSEYLLKLYLAGAVGGSIFYLIQHAFFTPSSDGRLWSRNSSNAPALGASGAVNAIMLLNIFLYPRATLYLDFIIPVPAILLGIFLIGKDMLRILEGDSQISGSAHLGGAVVAAIAWRRIKTGRL